LLTLAPRRRTSQGWGGTRRRHVAGSHWLQDTPRCTACVRLGLCQATRQHASCPTQWPRGHARIYPNRATWHAVVGCWSPTCVHGRVQAARKRTEPLGRVTWSPRNGLLRVGWPVQLVKRPEKPVQHWIAQFRAGSGRFCAVFFWFSMPTASSAV
jgi:hypothetical protein